MAITQQSSSSLLDFEKLARLGAGSFGEVFKVRRTADSLTYVLKQVNIDGMNVREQADAIQEVRIMASLNHPNVVRYFDSFLGDGKLNIVMEFCDQGDLQQFLKRHTRDRAAVPEDRIWHIFLQITIGLHYLHSQRILHRDMKSANVFLCKDFAVKIGDLGVARVLGTNTNFAKTSVGTPYYLSPELCEDKPYNEKSDVWALGCILYECCTLKHPFDAGNQGALILKIIQGRYEPVSARFSKPMRKLVDRLLTRDARVRPTVTALLSSDVCYKKCKELDLALPSDVEAVVAAKAKRAASYAPAAAPTSAAAVATAVAADVMESPMRSTSARNLHSPSLPPSGPKAVGMMRSPSGPLRPQQRPGGIPAGAVAASTPNLLAGGIRGDRIRKGATPEAAKVAAPRRLPLSAEAKASAAAAAAASAAVAALPLRPASRAGERGSPAARAAPTSQAAPRRVVHTPTRLQQQQQQAQAHSAHHHQAADDVAALPDIRSPSDAEGYAMARRVPSSKDNKLRPTVSQLAEVTQPSPQRGVPAGAAAAMARPRTTSPLASPQRLPATSVMDLDELMDRHLAMNVKVPVVVPVVAPAAAVPVEPPRPTTSATATATATGSVVAATTSTSDRAPPKASPTLPSPSITPPVPTASITASSSPLNPKAQKPRGKPAPVPAPVQLAKSTRSVIASSSPAVVPATVQSRAPPPQQQPSTHSHSFGHGSTSPEELEGVPDDFFDPVVASPPPRARRGDGRPVAKAVSDVAISTVEYVDPASQLHLSSFSHHHHHHNDGAAMFMGISDDAKQHHHGALLAAEVSDEDELRFDSKDTDGSSDHIGDDDEDDDDNALIPDYSFGLDSDPDEGEDEEDDDGEGVGSSASGSSSAHPPSLEELTEENTRLQAVLDRNLQSCKALLPLDVYERIIHEIDSGNPIDAGSFTTDPTGYLMIYKVAHFLTQMQDNEARLRELRR